MRKKIFFPLVFIFSLFFSLNVFAASLPSLSDILNYFAYNYTGVCLPADAYHIFNEWFIDNKDDVDKVHGGHAFSRGDDYVNDNVSFNSDGTTDLSNDLQFTFNQFIIDFIDEHPVSYSVQNIYPVEHASSTYFSTEAQFSKFVEVGHSLAGTTNFVFCPRIDSMRLNNYYYASGDYSYSNPKCIMWYEGTDNNIIDFYLSNGHVNNFNYLSSFLVSHNWINVTPYNSNYNEINYSGWHGIVILNDGSTSNLTNFFRPSQNGLFNNFQNSNFTINVGGCSIFNTSSRIMQVYAYDSINAIQLHDTGQPSPYYVTDSFNVYNFEPSAANVVNNAQAINNANLYNEIVNNISSGQSANELNIIINNIIDSNNDKPVVDEPEQGDDDDESLWDKIKDSVKDFFSAIAEVLRELVSLIVDTVLGVLTELIRGFKDILVSIKDFLIDSDSGQGFISILGGFFVWLPEPIPLFLKAIFTLACVFALIKLIKGLAS